MKPTRIPLGHGTFPDYGIFTSVWRKNITKKRVLFYYPDIAPVSRLGSMIQAIIQCYQNVVATSAKHTQSECHVVNRDQSCQDVVPTSETLALHSCNFGTASSVEICGCKLSRSVLLVWSSCRTLPPLSRLPPKKHRSVHSPVCGDWHSAKLPHATVSKNMDIRQANADTWM